MPEQGVGVRLSGVTEGVCAAAVGSLCLPIVKFIWPLYSNDRLPDLIAGVAPNLVAALVLIPAFVLLTPKARRAVFRLRPITPNPKGIKLSIYVAELDGDDDRQTHRRSLIDSITEQIGRNAVEVIPAGLTLKHKDGVSEDDAALPAMHEARQLLRAKKGDLLIWGRVHTVIGRGACVELRFVSANLDGTEGKRFGLVEDKLTLDVDFGPAMGTALSATVAALALPASENIGSYLVPKLRPLADRLQPLATNPPNSFKPDDQASLIHSYSLIELALGDQSGDSSSLERAVSACRDALKIYSRERTPLKWAVTRGNLGAALLLLGESAADPTRLEEAVVALREALEERTRERTPLGWAMSKMVLGIALTRLGERETDSARLEEASGVIRDALTEVTRERSPDQWIATQTSLGTVYRALSVRESGGPWLEQAVAAFRRALSGCMREQMPLAWAMAQNNLGSVLLQLGERENCTAQLKNGVAACREALKEFPRNRMPLKWALVQSNLATAFRFLGERDGGTSQLEDAIECYRSALKVYTREQAPFRWATTKIGLAGTLVALSNRRNSDGLLEEAAEACGESLTVITRERAPIQWCAAQATLGDALTALGERPNGAGQLAGAIAAYQEALKEISSDRLPLQWADTQFDLAKALRRLGDHQRSTTLLMDAANACRQALRIYSNNSVPLVWASAQATLGDILSSIGEWENRVARLEEAVAAYRTSLKEYDHAGLPTLRALTYVKLAYALRQLSEAAMQEAVLDDSRELLKAAENQSPDFIRIVSGNSPALVNACTTYVARLNETASAYCIALADITCKDRPIIWAGIQSELGIVFELLGKRATGAAELERAVVAYREALKVFGPNNEPKDWGIASRGLSRVEALLTTRRAP